MPRITKARKEEIAKDAVELKTLSEKVNKFLTDFDFAIKMEPGSVWFVADLKDRDWCISPKLKDLEKLHKWVADNNRKLQTRRADQERDSI